MYNRLGVSRQTMKNYVLDTNIVLYDPQSIYRFADNNVILPIYVIEEVDKFKHESTERGRNARQISRTIDALRAEGSLTNGVPLPGGGTFSVKVPSARPELVSAIDMATMVAKPGIALRSGRRDRRFKSSHSDWFWLGS